MFASICSTFCCNFTIFALRADSQRFRLGQGDVEGRDVEGDVDAQDKPVCKRSSMMCWARRQSSLSDARLPRSQPHNVSLLSSPRASCSSAQQNTRPSHAVPSSQRNRVENEEEIDQEENENGTSKLITKEELNIIMRITRWNSNGLFHLYLNDSDLFLLRSEGSDATTKLTPGIRGTRAQFFVAYIWYVRII
jgi:hypothetical protein